MVVFLIVGKPQRLKSAALKFAGLRSDRGFGLPRKAGNTTLN
jgi:hypothetical protein